MGSKASKVAVEPPSNTDADSSPTSTHSLLESASDLNSKGGDESGGENEKVHHPSEPTDTEASPQENEVIVNSKSSTSNDPHFSPPQSRDSDKKIDSEEITIAGSQLPSSTTDELRPFSPLRSPAPSPQVKTSDSGPQNVDVPASSTAAAMSPEPDSPSSPKVTMKSENVPTSEPAPPEPSFGDTWQDWDEDDNGALGDPAVSASAKKTVIAVAAKSPTPAASTELSASATPGAGERKRGAAVTVTSPALGREGGGDNADDDDDWDAPLRQPQQQAQAHTHDDDFDDWDADGSEQPSKRSQSPRAPRGSAESSPPPAAVDGRSQVSASGGIITSASCLAPGEVSALETTPALEPDKEFKTFGVGLSGAGGVALGGSPHWDGALPALHCQSCGHDVLRFRGCSWSAHAGYMHFRNFNGHSLNLPKLCQALVTSSGSAAYACQCAWQSIGGEDHGSRRGGEETKEPHSESEGGARGARKELNAWGTDPGTEGGAANGSLRWVKRKQPAVSGAAVG